VEPNGEWLRTDALGGHFSGYRRHQGVLVPARAEVGWYANGRLEIVWKGEMTSLEYEFGPAR
jgi:hypothetical protein